MQRFVKCVDTAGKDYLTVGEEYPVVEEVRDVWLITSKEGHQVWVSKFWCEEVKYDGAS